MNRITKLGLIVVTVVTLGFAAVSAWATHSEPTTELSAQNITAQIEHTTHAAPQSETSASADGYMAAAAAMRKNL